MAQQKFNAIEREAIWLAHDKKCAYTRERIDASNFDIDHVLPESLADDPGRFQKVKEGLRLNIAFDLRGFENLLPAKTGINLQKANMLLEPSHAHYFLSLAASKKPQIEDAIRIIQKRKSRDRALVLLQQNLENGALSPGEIANMLDRYIDDPSEVFPLLTGIRCNAGAELNTIAKVEIDKLRCQQINREDIDEIDGVILTHTVRDEEIVVTTCKEYDEAINSDYVPSTNYDIKNAAHFNHRCGLLRMLASATKAERSYIENPKKGLLDLHLLPASLFPWFEAPLALGTYQDKIDNERLVIRRVKQHLLVIEERDGMGQQLIEVARADFNGDGIEDILLYVYCYATHGTLGYGDIKIITRSNESASFTVINI